MLLFPVLLAAYPAPMPDLVVRVATYNIRHGRGMDDRLDLPRTAKAIGALRADIVGLQEVDRSVRRSESVDQPKVLGQRLKMHSAFGSFMDYDGGQYGMAILSKRPIRKSWAHRLPTGNEPRVALFAEVELQTSEILTVVNVHFDWVRDDRYRFEQATALHARLQSLSGPLVLLGDFNDGPESRTLGLFRKIATEASKPVGNRFTFNAAKPTVEIDYLFFAPSNRWSLGDAVVVSESAASDHRPVVVDATLRTQR